MSFYTPTLRVKHFSQVTPKLLISMGIKGIVTDLDDTLAPRNSFFPEDEVKAWFRVMEEAGIQICIVSNNNKKRTEDYATPLGVSHFHRAKKPLKKAVFQALRVMNLSANETVLLGDQLFTDMTAAYRCKMKSILVDPVGTYGGWFVQLKRKIEQPLRKNIPYQIPIAE